MRDQRRKEIETELPTGLEVRMILPDSVIARESIKHVPDSVAANQAAAGQQAQANQLRMCIKELDGHEVTFQDLRYKGLDKRVTPKEMTLLEQIMNKAIRPSEAEQDRFDRSIQQYREDGDWWWEGQMLTGPPFYRLQELEREIADARQDVKRLNDELDEGQETSDELEAARDRRNELDAEHLEIVEDETVEVSGILPSSSIKRQVVEQVPSELQDNPVMAMKEAQDNLLRNVVKEIDGESLGYPDLKGTELDKALSPKEQHLILMMVGDLSSGSQEEQDFLDEIQVG